MCVPHAHTHLLTVSVVSVALGDTTSVVVSVPMSLQMAGRNSEA